MLPGVSLSRVRTSSTGRITQAMTYRGHRFELEAIEFGQIIVFVLWARPPHRKPVYLGMHDSRDEAVHWACAVTITISAGPPS